jgi:hypothetical protein
MQINTGTLPISTANAERQAPDLPEAPSSCGGADADDFLSECALTMLIGESGPVRLVVLDLPPGLQVDDEDEQPKEG